MSDNKKTYSYISVDTAEDEDVIYVSKDGVRDGSAVPTRPSQQATYSSQQALNPSAFDSAEAFYDDDFASPKKQKGKGVGSTSAFDDSFELDNLDGEVPHERMKYGIIFALIALVVAFIIYVIAWGV